jgi:DNA-binding NtrC family response regulator
MKILVVEDDEAQLKWLEKNLSNHGHDIHTAGDGDLAIAAYLMSRPFDLVITDYCYPGKAIPSGSVLIKTIRAVDPGQLFIMQTGAEKVHIPRGIPLLHKPYSAKRLLLEISRAHKQRLPLFPFNSESL